MAEPDQVSTRELELVAAAQARVDAADAAVRAVVAAAREAGETWRHIGEAVGINDELARQRWGPGHHTAGRAKQAGDTFGNSLPGPDPGAPALRQLLAAQSAFLAARRALPEAVAAARAAGVRWRAIGQALNGISNQAAYERYGRNPDLPPRRH